MTSLSDPAYLVEPQARPAPPRLRPRLRDVFFGDLLAASLTVAMLGVILLALPPFLNWALIDAAWTVAEGQDCAQVGACWAFVAAKARLILFGLYPPSEHWRPMVVIAFFLLLTLASMPPRAWGRGLALAWTLGIAAILLLMRGGALGLSYVPTMHWGGLPVTLLLATLSLAFAFPLALALAVGRQSRLPVARYLSIGVIEIIRGTPLLSLLFVASILLPMFLPAGWSPDKLVRALVALTVFSTAYLAEVIRGGLQDIPPGQVEASRALGVSSIATLRHIVIPQALRKVIPPLTNTLIVMVKNTSLVFVVGLFDLLSSGRSALTDPAWPTPFVETYLFIGGLYFVICFSISLYARWLEGYLGRARIR